MNHDDSKQSLALPPLNLLFNPSLLGKKNVWEIDISNLLDLLLKLVNTTGRKDLRICGVAAWTSSLIYRLKVESIFRLEKLAMEKKTIEGDDAKEIPSINLIDFPFRLSSTYPVSLEDLLKVLQNMVSELINPRIRNIEQLHLEPVEDFNFDQYFIKFEKILQEHEDFILQSLDSENDILFSEFVKKMRSLEAVRFFIALLHLAMKRKVELIQRTDSYDIQIRKTIN